MSLPQANFPNETYLDGLRNADASVVESLYHEFRQPVVRSVESLGGNFADGAAFFRVALIQTAGLVQSGQYPDAIPVEQFIRMLAMRQYLDWREEKLQVEQALPEFTEEEQAVWQQMPGPSDLRSMRGMLKAKREFYRQTVDDQRSISSLAISLSEGTPVGLENARERTAAYRKSLGATAETSEDILPDYAVKALTNEHFHRIWSACEDVEQRLKPAQIPDNGENKTIKYAFLTLVVVSLGALLASWLFRDKTPEEVYQNNYQPPASIVADMEARYARDSIAPERPEACIIAFSEADAHYKQKDWRAAAEVLAGMMDDEFKPCQSDALFYLAIVGLEMDRPQLSLECISKIEDLERFGEDIYWYMALAYVKIAAQNPSEKDMARRAVERALSNTEIPERRTQAEKMLKDLSE
ncbi:MAG TPA: hypothetical protein VK168_05770 [Saprospiraceae bacterium]|nr:hypothetical protein [Saprospiraceae bacterium]